MTRLSDLQLAAQNRSNMNADFSAFEVELSKQAEYEQHSEITGINASGEWSSSVPGGGVVNRVRNHSNAALGIGSPMHLSKNTGIPSVDQKPTTPPTGFSNPVAEESISANIPSDFPAKGLQA